MSQILAIDAGTTGITVTLYDNKARVLEQAKREFAQIYPKPGWVEHDPEEIWKVTEELVRAIGGNPQAIGITNQRETTVIWERATGKPIYNAIVWQCRRTAPACEKLRKKGLEKLFRRKTGL
ncbi:MAG: FGGY family carbohydrate kinase, partial [Planctomycetota bacterium]|nr:FGGY family carbohydrate kinase [Planctomycetota bacterium]